MPDLNIWSALARDVGAPGVIALAMLRIFEQLGGRLLTETTATLAAIRDGVTAQGVRLEGAGASISHVGTEVREVASLVEKVGEDVQAVGGDVRELRSIVLERMDGSRTEIRMAEPGHKDPPPADPPADPPQP